MESSSPFFGLTNPAPVRHANFKVVVECRVVVEGALKLFCRDAFCDAFTTPESSFFIPVLTSVKVGQKEAHRSHLSTCSLEEVDFLFTISYSLQLMGKIILRLK
jgi:hypothetical protein